MTSRLVRRLFRSAWPTPSIDRLLRAALLGDEGAAAVAWREFETAADFDHLTPGEMRVIGIAAKRLDKLAPDSPMRARIGGIERANWSRSQLVIGEVGSGLRRLAAAGIDMLLIKGAARWALGGASVRGRLVNDVDVLVRPADMEKAFDVLTADDWLPAHSGTVQYHRARLGDAIGINLVKGQFGNLDLHLTPFHPPYRSLADDAAIWHRATMAKIAGVNARVPSPADFATIAMAHGSLDAHKSSDWIADIAACIDRGIDWTLLESIVGKRRLETPAVIAFGYVQARFDRPVPAALMARLEGGAMRRPLALLGALSETRPKTRAVGFHWLARAIAKQSRLSRQSGRGSSTRRSIFLPSFGGRGTSGGVPAAKVLEHPLSLPDRIPGDAWAGLVDLTLSVELPPATRRLDFEIVSNSQHHLRLRALVLNRGRREKLLRFKFPLSLSEVDGEPILTAVPSRRFNSLVPFELVDRYGAAPFAIVRLHATRSPKQR